MPVTPASTSAPSSSSSILAMFCIAGEQAFVAAAMNSASLASRTFGVDCEDDEESDEEKDSSGGDDEDGAIGTEMKRDLFDEPRLSLGSVL